MASPAEGNKYTVITNDKQEFEVDEVEAFLAVLIKNTIEDGCGNPNIPLPNVDGKTFKLVLEFLKKHAEMEKKRSLLGDEDGGRGKLAVDKEIKAWNAEFMGKVDTDTLYHLLLAANYLNIESLLNLGVKKTADFMKGKTPEKIREIFGITNDFTAVEEAEFRKNNQWAFP